jgi:hypothetical protein
MAQGNWNKGVGKARPRCRLCGHVVKKADLVRLDIVRQDGIASAHRACADASNRAYTVDDDTYPTK